LTQLRPYRRPLYPRRMQAIRVGADAQSANSPRCASTRMWLWVAALCGFLFIADLGMVESERFIGYEAELRNNLFFLFRDTLPFNGLPALHAISFVGVASDPYVATVALFACVSAITAAYLLLTRRLWSTVLLITAVSGAVALAILTKEIIVRPLDGQGRHSFPSGHAMCSFVVCAVLIYLLWHTRQKPRVRRVGTVLVLILGVLYGLSTLTFHYPSEVLGGYALGGAWLSLVVGVLSGRLAHETAVRRP
jgi:membrane-associated phospholipid phosphatase